MKKLILLCVALKLAGCASLQNEGVTSYGYQPPQNESQNKTTSLYQRFVGIHDNENHIISKDEPFSVKLISAHICDFDEMSISGYFRTSNEDSTPCEDSPDWFQGERTGSQGEIAIIEIRPCFKHTRLRRPGARYLL
jgi:hypothetical protein